MITSKELGIVYYKSIEMTKATLTLSLVVVLAQLSEVSLQGVSKFIIMFILKIYVYKIFNSHFRISPLQPLNIFGQVDCSNYDETAPKIMSEAAWFDFLLPHAENHLQVLKWTTIQKLFQHKLYAINAQPAGFIDGVGIILHNYRRGEADIEYFYNKQSRIFLNKLKNSIDKVKKQLKGQSQFKRKNITATYANQFVREMNEFHEYFTGEYNRIIPIIFPVHQRLLYPSHF